MNWPNGIKDKWFHEVLSDYLFDKADLYTYELAEWIEDILNTEFNTISEDGTLEPTAKLLIQMGNWLLGRGKETAEDAKQKLMENIQRLKGVTNKQVVGKASFSRYFFYKFPLTEFCTTTECGWLV